MVKGDKEGDFLMIKGSIYHEVIKIINTDVPNIGKLKYQYIKQKLIELNKRRSKQQYSNSWGL